MGMAHTGYETITITIEGDADFAGANAEAMRQAAAVLTEPMLIAWYDGQKGEEHPHVPECQHKPGWLAYAESHGGRIRVDVNDGEFSFIFAEAVD